MLDDLEGIPLPSDLKAKTPRKRRRPAMKGKPKINFKLEDLDLNNLDGLDPGLNNDNDDDENDIFRIQSDNDDFTMEFTNTPTTSTKTAPISQAFENGIIAYLDHSLFELSSTFRDSLKEIAEDAFNYNDKITDFICDLNNELQQIFQTEKLEFVPINTDDVLGSMNSLLSELKVPKKSNRSNYNNLSINSNKIEQKKIEIQDLSTDLLNELRIESSELASMRNSATFGLDESTINQKILEYEIKNSLLDLEKANIDKSMEQINEMRNKFIEENANQISEEIALKYVIENKDNIAKLMEDFNNSSNLSLLSDFSQFMAIETTNCRLMIEQLNSSIQQLGFLRFSFDQYSLDQASTKSTSNEPFVPSTFLEQMREKLKELQERRIEAKKSIEDIII